MSKSKGKTKKTIYLTELGPIYDSSKRGTYLEHLF